MGDEFQGAGHVPIGDSIKEIRLGFTPPYANYSSHSVFADFLVLSFHVAREFIELASQLVQIAADGRLKELDRGRAYSDL